MVMPQLPAGMFPDVPEEDHNDIVVRIAKEEGERVNDLAKVFPKLVISPGIEIPPRLRLQRGLQRILEAYQGDSMMAQQELAMIIDPDYVDKVIAGDYPPPLASPWRELLPLRFYLRQWHKTFVSDYDAFVKRLET